jgi:hypothetical protein
MRHILKGSPQGKSGSGITGFWQTFLFTKSIPVEFSSASLNLPGYIRSVLGRLD